MKPSETIIVHLDSVEQLLEPCPPSPFRQRRLREEGEQFLVERVSFTAQSSGEIGHRTP
jgi:hypothetical protein